MTQTVFFTIVAKNYISYARTLCQSIAKHHPDVKIYLGLSDKLDNSINLSDEVFEVIEASDLSLPEFQKFAFRYDVMEFSTAIKPYMFKWIFANTLANKVVYLDPDILVTSPLNKVLSLLQDGASAVLTPHLTSRIDDSFLPNENSVLQVGVYNLGFIALSRHDEAHKLVDWWCDRLERGAVVDLANGLFTDQKWADLMPGLFDDVKILRDPGYNAAYWNLMHRAIERLDGGWVANNQPLAFFHFSGVDPRQPEIFSKHQNRFTLANIGKLKELYEYYLDQLFKNGYLETNKLEYYFNYLSDGTKVHGAMRSYFRHMLDVKNTDITNPFNLTTTYFNQPEPVFGKKSPVTRFMYGLYKQESEMQQSFDLKSLSSQYAYANWFAYVAPNIYGVDREYVKPVQKGAAESSSIPDSGYFTYLKNKVLMVGYAFYVRHPALAKKIIRQLPAGFKARLRGSAKDAIYSPVTRLSGFSERFSNIFSKSSGSPKNEAGVTVVGYVSGDFGVAENLRSVTGCLDKVDYPFDIYEIDAGDVYSKTNTRFRNKITDSSAKGIQLYCVNADQVQYVQSVLGKQKVRGTYRIGYWFWELPRFPDELLHALELVDEVWAPTKFIYDALSKVTTKPLVHMPVAVDFEIQGQYDRKLFDLPDIQFLFLVSFDFHSFSTRKNAAAALAAFKQAFPEHIHDVGLVIKTIHGEKYPKKYAELLDLLENDERIHVINKVLSRDEMYGLIKVCDCYVSLHRSEGFGLGIAEAMLLGKPVIATGYSGNMDFMRPDNSCLIDYSLVDVKVAEYPHWKNQKWADPDIKQAAEYMHKIYSDEDFQKDIATKAQDTINSMHSSAVVGKRIQDRLDIISNKHSERRA
jgi:glycosyltransferase involved in cell wall biosynthesis